MTTTQNQTFGNRAIDATVEITPDGWIESDVLRGRFTPDAAIELAKILTRAGEAGLAAFRDKSEGGE